MNFQIFGNKVFFLKQQH